MLFCHAWLPRCPVSIGPRYAFCPLVGFHWLVGVLEVPSSFSLILDFHICSFAWCRGGSDLLLYRLGWGVGGEEDRGEEVKKLLHAWSPHRSPLQANDTQVVVSSGESKMTRRSLNHRNWSEGWEVQRILYARDPQSGERKVDVLVSFFACMQL